jgi:hypothetical protein
MIRYTRFRRGFDLRLGKRFYITNAAYPGEKQWYMRLGRRPGRVFHFGKEVT